MKDSSDSGDRVIGDSGDRVIGDSGDRVIDDRVTDDETLKLIYEQCIIFLPY